MLVEVSSETPVAVVGNDAGPFRTKFRKVVRPNAYYDHAAWRRGAACRDVDTELFFPVGTTGPALDEIERAKMVCSTCPVQAACLQFALTTNQEFGVWGGRDEEERRTLRRKWRAAAVTDTSAPIDSSASHRGAP